MAFRFLGSRRDATEKRRKCSLNSGPQNELTKYIGLSVTVKTVAPKIQTADTQVKVKADVCWLITIETAWVG